jgi:hypothetical protein
VTSSRTYSDRDLDHIFKREPLITEKQLLEMWPITKRRLRAIVNGHGPDGVHLPAVRFSAKQIAFRPSDVARVEKALWG